MIRGRLFALLLLGMTAGTALTPAAQASEAKLPGDLQERHQRDVHERDVLAAHVVADLARGLQPERDQRCRALLRRRHAGLHRREAEGPGAVPLRREGPVADDGAG